MVNPLGLTGREDENLFHKELSEVWHMLVNSICLAYLLLNPSVIAKIALAV